MENESSGSAKTDVQSSWQTEEVFRRLAENIREVVFVITPNPPRMAYVSQAYEKVFGKPREELYDRANAWIDAVDPQARSQVQRLYEESMQGVATDGEYRLIRPDGSVRWVHLRSFPVQNAKGKLGSVISIAEDITDSKIAMEEMEAESVAAEAANRAKSEFLANSDHEIRTAMNGIVGMTDLLLNTKLNPEQIEYVQMAKASADLLFKTISDLLDFFQARVGQVRIGRRPLRFAKKH